METKVLVIAVIKKDNFVLMRKKPDGSPPYKETWYLFGADVSHNTNADDAIKQAVKSQTNIEIKIDSKFSWDEEVKVDIDGLTKQFFYLDTLCTYMGGELVPEQGIEKLEWVHISNLSAYDIVPPSKIVFQKLGYITD